MKIKVKVNCIEVIIDSGANAFINNVGAKYSHNNKGQLHNVDGPSSEFSDGDESWFLNNKPHRKYGPARKWEIRGNMWWFKGVRYTQKEFMERFL